MSLQFYLGASGSGKSYQLHRDILKDAKKNFRTNYLLIVPDQATMQTQLDLVEASDSKGIMNVDVLSFSRLAHRIFEELGCNNNTVLDDTGKSLVIRNLAGRLKDSLPTLGRNLDKVGYIHEIKSAISEFKQYDISESKMDELISFSSTSAMLNGKLKDLKTIYEAFNNYIRDEFITSEETLMLLSEKIYESNIIKNSVIAFDGFTGFTPIQYRLIKGLMELTSKVIVTVTIDINSSPYHIDGEMELFYLSKKTIRDLQSISQSLSIVQEPDVILNTNYRHYNNISLAHLEKSIFRFPIKPYMDETDSIFIDEAANPEEEARNILSRINDLVLNDNYEYRDIAIVCGELSAYKYEFLKYSNIYNIPIYIDETRKIGLNPFVEYIMSALNIIKDNFTYSSVMHFLRSGLADVSKEKVDTFDNYIIKCGIRGKRAYSNSFTRVPYLKSEDEVTTSDIEALLELNETREKLILLLEPLMGRFSNVGELVKALYEFVIKSNIENKLAEYEKYFEERRMPEKAKEYSQIYRLIMDLLDQIYALLRDEEVSLEEFIKILESGIDEIDVGTIPGTVDQVLIGDIERSRISKPKILFFAGVNDGSIPKANDKGGLISDIDREFLKASNIELSSTPREQIYTQRLYLYLNMIKPSKKLYFSYSRMTGGGKSVKRSYLIGQILKCFPKIKINNVSQDVNEFNRISGIRDGISIFSGEIRNYAEEVPGKLGYEELKSLYFVLLKSEEGEKLVRELIETAFFEYKPNALTGKIAKKIFDNDSYLSISRLEKFASCEYAHFLSYAMRLKERDEFDFKKKDMGNVFHSVFEQFGASLEKDGYTLADFPDEIVDKKLEEIIENLSVNYKSAVLHSSNKSEYMLKRIFNTSKFTVLMLKEQLSKGSFKPEAFEKKFVKTIDLDDDTKATLGGVIDRIDICQDEDKLYVKVIDYKSSSKNIELDQLLYGLQIQQPVYMMAAIDAMEKKYPHLRARMGAMLYYHINNPLVDLASGMEDEALDEARSKALTPAGLVAGEKDVYTRFDSSLLENNVKSSAVPVAITKDGELHKSSKTISCDEYELIDEYVNKLVKDEIKSIQDGNIAINPKAYENWNSCQYCDYKSICQYDEKKKGFKTMRLTKLSKEEALEKMNSK
ncbi:MAG: PD-(D/E)XK nuclease family protein [Lachnospiraceae bacterium]|nr:PD-(D/E)XK nuclease family protein [Lachnospiraceae bacterium]